MKGKKIVITLFLFFLLIAGGVSVAADPGVSGLLKDWFQDKSDEAAEEIDEEVDEELNKQTDRLKEELKPIINSAENKIDNYTESEKQKAINRLEAYTDEMIDSIKANDAGDLINQEAYEEQLETIVDDAIDQMENVEPKLKANPDVDNDSEADGTKEADQDDDSDHSDKEKDSQN